MPNHLGPGDAPENQEGPHSAGNACLNLSSRDSQNGAAEGFGHVGTEDKTNRPNARDELVDFNVIPQARQAAEVIGDLLTSIKAASSAQDRAHLLPGWCKHRQFSGKRDWQPVWRQPRQDPGRQRA